VVSGEPITRAQEPQNAEGDVIEHCRPGPALGRTASVATPMLKTLGQTPWMLSAEPITSTQGPQTAGRGVIEHQDRRRPGQAVLATGHPVSRPEQRGRAAHPEPITSTQGPQTAECGVIEHWWGTGSSPGRAASRAVWTRDGPARGRGAMGSASITPAREPSRTNPALLVRRGRHLYCGRCP
jgi:hypothetical protein